MPRRSSSWRSQASSGYGALDDFGVHPMSLIATLIGPPSEVFGEMSKPYPDRADGGGRRTVETFDITRQRCSIARMADGGVRNDPGEPFLLGPEKPPPIAKGVWRARLLDTVFDQERFNEVGIYVAEGPPEAQGFKQVLMGPAHPPYEQFLTAPGRSDGLQRPQDHRSPRTPRDRILEAARADHRFLDAGLAIERTIHAIARSSREGRWVSGQLTFT